MTEEYGGTRLRQGDDDLRTMVWVTFPEAEFIDALRSQQNEGRGWLVPGGNGVAVAWQRA